MRLLVVVGMHVCARAVVVVDMDVGGCSARLRAWAVGGRCGWSCRDGGRCGWSRRDHRGRGRSSPFVFVGGRLSLLEVIVVGGCRRLLSLCVGGGRVRSLWFVVCVDGGGKEEGSHVTHRDNGITLDPPREITCNGLTCK